MNHLNISLLPSPKSIIRVMIESLIDSDNIIYLHSLNINFYNTCSIGLLHDALKPVFGFVALIADCTLISGFWRVPVLAHG